MSRRDRHDVIVVGAGVVGAAAALRLAREGLRVAIVEAHEPGAWHADAPDLKVYAFAPDAQALLESLGVWASVASARAHPYRRMRVWDAAGGGELCFDADDFGRSHLGFIVEHQLLVARLWAALQREAGVECFCPERVAGLEQDDQGVVLLLQSGASLRARFLLGADGAASKVRELAGISVRENDYQQQGLVAYVQTEQPHEDTAWQRFLPTGPIAFLPCADGRCSIVWTLPQDEAQRLLDVDDASFGRELTRAFDARLGSVLSVSGRKGFPLRRRLAEPMLQGRVALIGDAAHVVHPLAGQGVNLGLRDVDALGSMIADARARGRSFDSAERWQRWARSRGSENAVAARSFEAINSLFSNDSPLPTLLRGHLLGAAGKIPPVSAFLWRRAAGL
jgi:2-octaprenyl-3-methyl-6-methoxy-1,4-benzoquinol hydroxylase